MTFLEDLDRRIQDGPIGRFFEMKKRNTTVRRELGGALCTFMSMSYILAVNPRILADSGGPCVAEDGNVWSKEYETCREGILREYITATAISSMMGCFFMGE